MSGSAIYNVGVHISAVNGMSGVLAALSKQVLGLHGSVHHLNDQFRALRLGVIGAGLAGAGVGILKVAEHFEMAGEKLAHVQTLFEAALPVQTRIKDMANVTAIAVAASGENMRTSISDNIEAMHDLYNITQSIPESKNLLPAFNMMKNVLENSGVSHGEHSNRDVAGGVRAIESTGRVTTEQIKPLAEQLALTFIALNNRVKGGQLLTQTMNMGDLRFRVDDEFMSKAFPVLVANGLNNKTGSSLYQAHNNMYGGVSSSEMQAMYQEKYGLHSKQDELHDSKGKFRGFKPGSMWHGEDWAHNPLNWANDYLKFLETVKHVDIHNKDKMALVIGEIARGNKGLKQTLDELLLPDPNKQLNKEMANINNVGADASNHINENDPKALRQALMKQWESATEALGRGLVDPLMNNVIKPLTVVTNAVAKFAMANPEAVKAVAVGVTVLGAALVVLGGAAIVAAAAALIPGGAIALAVVAVGSIIAGLVAYNWEGLKNGFNSVKQTLDGFVQNMDAARDRMIASIKGLYSNVTGQISSTFSAITGAFTDAIKALGSAVTSAISGIAAQFGNIGGTGGRLQTAPGGGGGRYHPSSYMGGTPRVGGTVTAHTTVKLDGKVLAQAVTKHQVASAQFPTSHGGTDNYGSYMPPGSGQSDAA